MDVREAQRRALIAVAKVALFAGAVGCGGSVVVATDDVAEEPGPAEAPGTPVLPYGPTTAPTTLGELPVDAATPNACWDGVHVTEDGVTCCTDVLADRVLNGEIWSDPAGATTDEKSCCELALDAVDAFAGTGEPPFPWDAYYTCCSVTGESGSDHPACTPWGPPMPPEMPADLLGWGLA